jgi:hypothetical protein
MFALVSMLSLPQLKTADRDRDLADTHSR